MKDWSTMEKIQVLVVFALVSLFVVFLIWANAQSNENANAISTCVSNGYADFVEIKTVGKFCYRINGARGELIRPSELLK